MNIIDKVKALPTGTKLYSPLFGEVTYGYCTDTTINVDTKIGPQYFQANGSYFASCGECLLFPSKECQSWDELFKKGDIIVSSTGLLAMFEKYSDGFVIYYSSLISQITNYFQIQIKTGIGYHKDCRLATPDEKEKFFRLFKERHNLIWDGNRFIEKATFDFNSFKPFDQVLLKTPYSKWCSGHFSHYTDNTPYKYATEMFKYQYCIPYNEETKHLINTEELPPEKYRE